MLVPLQGDAAGCRCRVLLLGGVCACALDRVLVALQGLSEYCVSEWRVRFFQCE